ncbi:MAG: 2Fe-2S iron-sulfur cluster binding domain-containing protein [Verrucomicrobiae bacterium]|nr:2Fe-2S iron-sulfur cluster binding domain-containing protein [Verrucomicrobiae bacterium]
MNLELGVNVGTALGFLLMGIVLCQSVLMLVSSAGRSRHESAQQELERRRLETLIRLAKARLVQAESARNLWNGVRKFSVARKTEVCRDVFAFDLRPHDGRPLPAFKPGQYLTFQLNIPGQDRPVIRCYSLSSSPAELETYRVTIKREPAPRDRPELPPGLASGFFADAVNEGDILDTKAPTGHFFLDLEKNTPIVLLSGGVGITPMLSMAKAVAARGVNREVHFFFGCRSGQDHIHRDEVAALDGIGGIKVHVCYSRPEENEQEGRDYHHKGRITLDLLKEQLPSRNYEFYMCGNGAFMSDLHEGLEAWGVPDKKIHFEAFGPATVKKKAETVFRQKETMRLTRKDFEKGDPTVTFARSSVTVKWSDAAQNLLEFGREKGARIDSGCCAGSCGSCLVAIKSGEVEYLNAPDDPPEDGSCLTCICIPKTDLVLDA